MWVIRLTCLAGRAGRMAGHPCLRPGMFWLFSLYNVGLWAGLSWGQGTRLRRVAGTDQVVGRAGAHGHCRVKIKSLAVTYFAKFCTLIDAL